MVNSVTNANKPTPRFDYERLGNRILTNTVIFSAALAAGALAYGIFSTKGMTIRNWLEFIDSKNFSVKDYTDTLMREARILEQIEVCHFGGPVNKAKCLSELSRMATISETIKFCFEYAYNRRETLIAGISILTGSVITSLNEEISAINNPKRCL